MKNSHTETGLLFPLHESYLHDFGKFVFLFAWPHQYKHSFVRIFLGHHCLLHHWLSVGILGLRLPPDCLRLCIVLASHFRRVGSLVDDSPDEFLFVQIISNDRMDFHGLAHERGIEVGYDPIRAIWPNLFHSLEFDRR